MPRFGPAVLRALAEYADARRAHLAATFGDDAIEEACWQRYDAAHDALNEALLADGAAHPVPVGGEGERDVSPHRFAVPRGMEPL